MIFRLLLILLLIWAIYKVLQLFRQPTGQHSKNGSKPEKMLKCDYCGTHIPSHEAIRTARGTYCCPQHRDQDQAK